MALHIYSIEDISDERLRYDAAQRILKRVSAVSGVSVFEMRSENRQDRAVKARHIAMYLIREQVGYSFPRIGRIMNKHYTTVINACEQMERALKAGGAMAQRIREIAG